MGTTNYNFTYLEPNNPIDLVGDTTTFLDEIDTTIKTVYDNIPQFDPTEIENDISDLQSDVTALDNGIRTANGNISSLQTSLNALANKFPIGSNDLAVGSVIFEKIAQSAIKNIIGSITVRRFDSHDSQADNGSTSLAPSGASWVAGYYIEEWKLLVITNFIKAASDACGSWLSGNTGFRVPDYIPHVTAESQTRNGRELTSGSLMQWNDSTDFVSWTAFGISTDGSIGPNTIATGGNAQTMMGTAFAFLGALGANS